MLLSRYATKRSHYIFPMFSHATMFISMQRASYGGRGNGVQTNLRSGCPNSVVKFISYNFRRKLESNVIRRGVRQPQSYSLLDKRLAGGSNPSRIEAIRCEVTLGWVFLSGIQRHSFILNHIFLYCRVFNLKVIVSNYISTVFFTNFPFQRDCFVLFSHRLYKVAKSDCH